MTRWIRPSDHEIATAMRKASARLQELYPGAILNPMPMTQKDFGIGDFRFPVFNVGLIGVMKPDGTSVGYSVLWDTSTATGKLKAER